MQNPLFSAVTGDWVTVHESVCDSRKTQRPLMHRLLEADWTWMALHAKMLSPKRQAVFLKESRDVDCSSGNLEAATDNLYNVGHFRSWHFSDVPGWPDDVCC